MEIVEPARVVAYMRFWKKQKGVEHFNFSEKAVLAGTHCPNIILPNGAGYMLNWPGDQERALAELQMLTQSARNGQQLQLF